MFKFVCCAKIVEPVEVAVGEVRRESLAFYPPPVVYLWIGGKPILLTKGLKFTRRVNILYL